MFGIYALVINFVFGTAVWLFLTRLMLQWVRAPFNNSFVQSLYMALAPVLRVFEKFIPRYGNFNIACAVVIALIGLIWAVALTWSIGAFTFVVATMLVLQAVYWQLLLLLFVYVLSSFLQPSPYNEMMQVILALVRPIVAPFRRIIPPLGPLDLSVAVAMLTVTIVYQLLVVGLQNLLAMLAPGASV